MSSFERFWRGNALGTFDAVKGTALFYLDDTSLKTKLVCMAMDSVAVNFGVISGVIKLMCDYVVWSIKFHCQPST